MSPTFKRTKQHSSNHSICHLSAWKLLVFSHLSVFKLQTALQTCLAEAREAKVLARVALSVTGKFFVTTSRASPSLPSDVWPAVVASSVSQALSTKKPVASSRYFQVPAVACPLLPIQSFSSAALCTFESLL